MRGLVRKGGGFSEEDKTLLRAVELELLNRVIPEYRDAAARGQIELSASPFYHPILPLLCDTDIYLRTHPDARRPRQPFRRPEDAAEQLERAAAYHARLFGARPVGLWPSEGSVSDAMVPLVAAAGFAWMATDELILAQTLGLTFTRDGHGHVEQPEHLYAPYTVRAGGAPVACTFRDHVLSDLIGFTYSGWPADAAADDFVGRLVEAGRRFAERTGGGDALIPIILDGENAWEHFRRRRAPVSARALPPARRTIRSCARSRWPRRARRRARSCRDLSRVRGSTRTSTSGSAMPTTSGHGASSPRRGGARRRGGRAGVDAAALAEAREEMLIAEGSDWFWWYGDDHSSAHDLEFDDLFRTHLRNAYRRLQAPVPDELFVEQHLDGAGGGRPRPSRPGCSRRRSTARRPATSSGWAPGVLEVREVAGAMHQIDKPAGAVSPGAFRVRYGAAVRPRSTRRGRRSICWPAGESSRSSSSRPAGVRFSVRSAEGRLAAAFWDRREAEPHWVDRGPGGAAFAAGTILEIRPFPLVDLGASAGEPIAFFVAVYDERGIELERHPSQRPIELVVPDALFAVRYWRA